MEECHKLLTDSVDDPILRHNVSKPLPLGGLPGQVTIQSDFFFNKYLEYLRYDSKGSRPALSISKMKATYYPDAGLEQMVPDQFWIDEDADRTYMRILSVVRIEVFSMYGYDYMKKIVLRRVDLNEHVIAERDFKYLYPSDFEDLYLLNLQGVQDQQDESSFKYEVLDQEGRGSEQGVHVRHSEAIEDKEDLSQPGELCWWTRQRWRLQTLEAYRMITSFWHSRSISEDFLRSLKPKRTIESRAKRSSKIISLGDYSIMLASSHTVKTNELTDAFGKLFEVLNNVFEYPRWENDPGKLGTAPDLIERLVSDQSSNPTSSTNLNPKGRNRRRSKQQIENSNLEEHSHPVVTMTDQRTMAELLCAPTEGTTNLLNEISNFQQRFDESIHVAWDRYKDLLRACPHHGFTKLHQLDTFYNALNPTDQDSLNAVAGGNLLKRSTQDVLTIIKNKSKQTSVVTIAMTAMLKQFQPTSPPAPVKAVEETCVTCGAAVNYNQGNPGYRPSGFNHGNEQSYQAPAQQNQNVYLNELEKVRRMNEANMKALQTQIDMVKNELRNEMKNSIQTSLSNQTNKIKNMMASLLQMNTASTSGSGSLPSNIVANPKGKLKAITTRSGLVIDRPTVPTPPQSIKPKVDERVEETFTDPNLVEYTIKVPPPPVQKYKPSSQREYVVHKRDPLHPNIPYPSRMLKQKQQEKDKVQIQNFWQMFKKLHINITLADALILMPKYQKMLKALLSNKEKLQELANTPLNENCSATARALIDVHGEEIILRNGDKRLILNMRHYTCSYSNQPQKESINLINVFNNSNDNLQFDIESDLKEIEFLLYQDKDSSLKDSIDQKNLANLADIFVDSIPEMFIDEHALDYSSPLIFDEYDDDKKLAISNASLVLEDFDHPFYEPLFFKEVPKSKMLLPFSSENEEKVFKPGIHTSGKVHSSFITELSHQGYKAFKINQTFKSLMKIFLFYCGKDTHILAVTYHHFYSR
nr:hypothetical protein [Tanacetum cinerariifolium]